jgi:hypothetical protein
MVLPLRHLVRFIKPHLGSLPPPCIRSEPRLLKARRLYNSGMPKGGRFI